MCYHLTMGMKNTQPVGFITTPGRHNEAGHNEPPFHTHIYHVSNHISRKESVINRIIGA